LFAASPENEQHGLTQHAVEIARPLGLPITNSMVVTWIVAAGLIIFARVATRDMKGSRRSAELPGMAHRRSVRLSRRSYWPTVGQADILVLCDHLHFHSVGELVWPPSRRWHHWVEHKTADGFKSDEPLFRGANADLNLTLAMALVFFACWIVFGAADRADSLRNCSRPRAKPPVLMKVLMAVVFFAVGCLEIVSILFRPVSLSFRL
jgi:F-type H+-transporting ATPase subunit a